MLELNDANFDTTVAKGIAIVDFWAPWCGPCKMMTPILEKIAKNNPNLTVGKVDIDKTPGIASKFNVMSIPTLIILKDGQPVEQTVGVVSEKVIMEKIAGIN